MPRKPGPTQRLALWFWEEILEKEEDFWQSPSLHRYLGEAKRIRKVTDEEILKQSLLNMKDDGIDVSDMFLSIKWTHTRNGPTWYEWTEQQLKTPPPIYEVHAFKAWCIANGRDDLLEMLKNDGIS